MSLRILFSSVGGRGRIFLGAIAMTALIIGAGCSSSPPVPSSFYSVPAGSALRGKPGDILRTEPVAGVLGGASAVRILYVSSGVHGNPILVSGVVIFPTAAPTNGPRGVVAWAHATTGVAESCAPSLLPHVFATIPGLSELLTRGYVVTATDYPGLGTVGPHPYLVGLSEGRAVLDSVRAAGRLPGTKTGSRFAVWGHSQGGHAVLFAGELARNYAPELSLVGIAAAAPATDLATLLKDDIDSPVGRVLAAYTLSSWSKIYGARIDPFIAPVARPAFDRAVADCVENIGEAYRVSVDIRPLRTGFPVRDVSTVAPWPGRLTRNTPGQARAGAPLFISQGTIDPIVRPDVTAQFVMVQRRRGETVRFVKLDRVGHMTAGKVSAPAAVAWIDDRFADRPAPNDDVIQPK